MSHRQDDDIRRLLEQIHGGKVQDERQQQAIFDAAARRLLHECDWRYYEEAQQIICQAIMTSDRWLVGEPTLAAPLFTAEVQLKAAQNHAKHVLKSIPHDRHYTYHARGSRIRLGFVGCDFYEQATSYLMVGFIEAMDRSRFELFAYDTGPEPPSTPFRQRVVNAYDHMISLHHLTDVQAADRIHQDRIDVLFSIKNPASARLGIFARRPAPIQIHYLYYPGTSGMPFFDYILADDIVIPKGHEHFYSEKVLRMEGCYQPNDASRPLPQETSRSQWGLPEDAVVMANFSQTYKITPQMFSLWCQLLQQDNKRILWLLCEQPHIQQRLRQEVSNRGIDPGRIFFTAHLSTQQHLNRIRQADLIVDTYPYGGHTLTSDALWAGTPVVTMTGEIFASRVAASLLMDVGMGELVAHDEREYVGVADALLSQPEQLGLLRQRLDTGKRVDRLSDPQSYAHRLESCMPMSCSGQSIYDAREKLNNL